MISDRPGRRLLEGRAIPDRAALPAVAFAGFAVIDALFLLVRTGFNPSRLVHAAPPLSDQAAALPSLTVLPEGFGFDGQFYYRLAIAPFAGAVQLGGVSFDEPALRGSRIGFGIVGYLLSAGQPALVPAALLIANVLLFGVLGLLTGRLAQSAGRHAGCGLLLLIWPGFVYSLALDTAEILAAVFVIGGLLALRRHRQGIATLALTGAVLTRESTVTIVAALWVAAVVQLALRREQRCAVGVFVASSVAAVAYVAVQLYGYLRFGKIPLLSSGQSNLGIPFRGVADALGRAFPPSTPSRLLDFTALILVLLVLAAGLFALRRSPAVIGEKAAWATTALMMIAITGPWISAPSSMRAGVELVLMTVALLFSVAPDRLPRRTAVVATAYLAAVWVLTVGTMLVKAPTPS